MKTPAGPSSVRSLLNGSRLSWVVLGVCLIFQVREAVLCDNTYFSRAVWRLFPDHSRSRSVPYTGDQFSMLTWIRENTSEDAVFLSHQGNSPSILTYAGRAINLHPKLETQGLREKYKTMLLTLFGEDEQALYRLFDLFETDYYLYPVTNLLQVDGDGERYMAGLSKVSRRSLVFRLHFDPTGFRRLRLVYRNRYSQIYRVVDEQALQNAGAGYVAPYFPVYDPYLFSPDNIESAGFFDDTRVDEVLDRIVYTLQMMRKAGEGLSRDDRPLTENSIWQALAIGLPDGHAYYQAADYMARMANLKQALAYIRKALAYDPENIQFKKTLARIHAIRGEPDQALAVLMAVSRKNPEDVVVYNDMGIAFWKKKQFVAARENFLRALALDPDYSHARYNLGVLDRSEGP